MLVTLKLTQSLVTNATSKHNEERLEIALISDPTSSQTSRMTGGRGRKKVSATPGMDGEYERQPKIC